MTDRQPDTLEALAVSRETRERLDSYLALLKRWNTQINLVARSTMHQAWTRHILDSAQLYRFKPETAKKWVDLGSGGGLPGLVIAVLAATQNKNDLRVVLIESDQRKCAFLNTVTQTLDLPATIIAQRLEDAAPQNADVVSARALAPLPRLLPMIKRHVAPHGIALLPKGASYETEMREARKTWHFEVKTHTSVTDHRSVVLEVAKIAHA